MGRLILWDGGSSSIFLLNSSVLLLVCFYRDGVQIKLFTPQIENITVVMGCYSAILVNVLMIFGLYMSKKSTAGS